MIITQPLGANANPISSNGFSGLFGITTALLRVKILERICNETTRFLNAFAALFPVPGKAVSLLLLVVMAKLTMDVIGPLKL